MKSIVLAISVFAIALLPARAEMQFPEFAKLSQADQQAWGYTATVNNGTSPDLSIRVAPHAAKACKGARLYIRDAQNRTLAEINAGLTQRPDGSVAISVSLEEPLRGSAELIVYSDFVQGAPITPNFGGFTFRLLSPQP